MDRAKLLTEELTSQMRQHALEAFPEEACGVIDSQFRYVRMKNVCPEPELGGVWDPAHLQDMLMAGDVVAMFHSHPSTETHPCEFAPSQRDMESQIKFALPWVLMWTNGEACSPAAAWGDQLDRLPLIGRTFHHGISDCYELIRDQKLVEEGIYLPQFPRSWEWWKTGLDLYTDGFPKAKFRRIDISEVRPNDVALFHVRSKVPNHGGIVRERGLLLHHPSSYSAFDPAKPSRVEPLARWMRTDPIWLRYSETD